MAKEHELASPVDISDMPITGAHPLGWTMVTIAVATIALLLTNPAALSGWIDEQEPSTLQQQASDIANGWTAQMDALGISAPRHRLHALWKQAQAVRFGDEAPAAGQ